MAATGFTPIQLYRTTTASAQPSAGNLADGELAINLTDKKLYAKDASNNVYVLADASSGGTTATNLAGGAAGSVPYQTGANATTFLGIGTAAQVLQVNSGATAPEWVNTSGTGDVARTTSPSFTTPSLGAATALSINSLTLTTSTGTFTLANGKTLTVNNSLTLNGTDATVMTFPSTSATIARTDAAQTFTGTQTVQAAATQDAVALAGRAGGTSSYVSTLTPTTLSASRTVTLPDADTTVPVATQVLTFTGPTAGRTITLPDANFTVARSDAAQSFTGTQTFLSNPVLDAGTANGVLFLNASKVVTSGSALTFDGLTLLNNQGSSGTSIAGNALFGLQGTSNSVISFNVPDANAAGLFFGYGGNPYWAGIEKDGSIGLKLVSGGSTLFTIAGSEQMRLTSTGLGIGTSSPLTKFNVESGDILLRGGSMFFGPTAGANGAGRISSELASSVSGSLIFSTLNSSAVMTEGMRLDSSGNLGLGVTPSAWNSGWKAIQVGAVSALWTTQSATIVSTNNFNDGVGNKYLTTGFATRYQQASGGHVWETAPSGTAGDPISFTQAMTLDASGKLLIGQTAEKTQEVVRVASSGQASMLLDNTGKTNGGFVGVFNDAALFGVNRNPSTGVFYNTSNYAAEVVAVGSSTTSYITFGTTTAANTTPTERARITSGGNFKIGGSADRATTEGDKQLVLFDGTAPVGTLANGVSFYSASGEANVMDAAGNATLLSPHDAETNEWIFRSKHTPTGKVLKIDVERLLKFVNDHFGLDAVHEFVEV